jgi:RHS repeat-associated protein
LALSITPAPRPSPAPPDAAAAPARARTCSADRISDAGFSYDDNGALLTDGTRTFTYDALGRLTGVSASGLSASYELDGDGNRVSQTVDSVTTDFDLDLRGLPTVLVAGDLAYLPGMPSLGYLDGADWFGALADTQGSILRHIDDTGSMTALTRYDPYGGARGGTSLPEGFGYTGEWADGSGLVNLRARAYDPVLGAFTSRDPVPGLPTQPLSGNRHAYAHDNPMRFTDPSGRFVDALFGSADLPATSDEVALAQVLPEAMTQSIPSVLPEPIPQPEPSFFDMLAQGAQGVGDAIGDTVSGTVEGALDAGRFAVGAVVSAAP